MDESSWHEGAASRYMANRPARVPSCAPPRAVAAGIRTSLLPCCSQDQAATVASTSCHSGTEKANSDRHLGPIILAMIVAFHRASQRCLPARLGQIGKDRCIPEPVAGTFVLMVQAVREQLKTQSQRRPRVALPVRKRMILRPPTRRDIYADVDR